MPQEKPHVLLRELVITAKHVRRHMDETLAAAGSSTADFRVLDALSRQGNLNQRELAGRLGIEGPTMTRQLESLARQGLIERVPDQADRRAFRLHVTPAGQAAYERLHPVMRQLEYRLISQLSPEEVATMVGWLGRVRESLTAAGPGSGP